MKKSIIIMGLALAVLCFCSCKNSIEAEYDAGADTITKTFRADATNWAAANGVNLQTNKQVSGVIDTIAKAIKSDTAKGMAINMVEAGEFSSQLYKSNRLPGVAKDEHGNMFCEVPLAFSNKLLNASYPMELTFHFVKIGYTSTNNYIFVKDSKIAVWELQRAWETDSKGKIIQEWPVK